MDSSEYEKMYQLEVANWWYAGRRALALNIFAKIYGVSEKTIRILDAGCGTGINLSYLQTRGNVCGLDISKDALQFSRSRGLSSLICGSADKLPIKDELFDIVLALDVIEHIEEDLSAIKELNRVLKSGGILIITVPAFQILWTSHDLAVHHKRRYTRPELLNILKLGGFEIEKATYWNFFLFLPVATIRLLKRLRRSELTKQTDLVELPTILNSFLYGLLKFENSILDRFDLPFGVSVMCVCRKV